MDFTNDTTTDTLTKLKAQMFLLLKIWEQNGRQQNCSD